MRASLLAILVLLAIAGCGGDDPPETAAPAETPTPNPTIEAEPSDAAGSAANAFIGSLAVDPADGTLMIGTGLGLFRAEKGASKAERVTGELTTPDGAGPVSSNLVIRYAGPGELLGSGHPEGGGTALPENLGLIRSGDAGDTWEPVSQLGESDFHILQARGDHVVAVRVDETDIQVSGDGGAGFESRTPPDMPLDVAFDPKDPQRMVVATAAGHVQLRRRGRLVAAARPDPHRAARLGEAGRALPSRHRRADQGQRRRRRHLEGPRHRRPPGQRARGRRGGHAVRLGGGRRGPPLDRRRRHLEAPATAGVARSARTRAARRPRSRPPGCRSRWR